LLADCGGAVLVQLVSFQIPLDYMPVLVQSLHEDEALVVVSDWLYAFDFTRPLDQFLEGLDYEDAYAQVLIENGAIVVLCKIG